MFPRGSIARILAISWLTVCLAVLVNNFIHRHDTPDSDIIFGISLMVLTFPVGYILSICIGIVFRLLHDTYGVTVPGGFLPNLIEWPVFVALGYFQWFVLIPWLGRKLVKIITPPDK